jgi:hypothetical protein
MCRASLFCRKTAVIEISETFNQYPKRELATAALEIDRWLSTGLLPTDGVFLGIANEVAAQGVSCSVKELAQELLRFLARSWANQTLK